MATYKRKQYIVDKKFQLRTTFSIIGFIFLIVALLTAIIGVNASSVNKKIANIVEIEDQIVQVLTVPNPELSDANQKQALEIAQNHNMNMTTLREMIKFNQILLWIIIGIIFVQGFIMFFVLIKQTHRIVGPLYVMSMYMRQIIDGKIPDSIRPLREKDMFKDFYELFKQMVEKLKADNKIKPISKPSKPVKAKK